MAQEVADSFKLPRFVLRTSGIGVFRASAAIPLLREEGYLPIQASRLEDPVPELPPLRVKDLPFAKNFQPQASSSLVQPDESSISWLDKQAPKSVIYVSFGSIAAVKENEFVEIAWGLAYCEHTFLWVIRPGSVHGSKWLESLPSGFLDLLGVSGHIVKWAPQLEVLAHPAVGAFWTHNGWNSTLESICAGVPMICMPCFTDQFVNARYVTHVWKVGVQLENVLERKTIEEVIRRLMEDEEGEEIRNRVEDFKEKAIFSLRRGGSSYATLECLISCISSS
ncbi:UDP-glycosyltransferase 76F1 [Forsythia ovata]|uniref:UDP-glycosyltransferase 76F1 n=1 Tax=Forsythia ovata TaxID=205694 RepID=A0ABD1X866_9LAMI